MDSTTRNLAQTIADLAAPLAASLGLALWGVEVVPAGRCIIRVYAESLDAFTENRSILTEGAPAELEKSANSAISANSDVSDGCDGFAAPESSASSAPLNESDNNQHPEVARSGINHDELSQDEMSQDEMNRAEVSQGGISIDQCAELSRLLGLTLEVEDCVESAYVLEVSSPGLNRVFFQPEQLARAIGAKVEAVLVKPLPGFPGRKKYIGTLVSVEGDTCTLAVTEPDDVTVDIPWKDIRKIRQVYVMPEKRLPGKSLKNTRQKKSAAKKKK